MNREPNDENEIDEEYGENEEYNYIINRIDNMYEDVIVNFQSGRTKIYNPDIMKYMTRDHFFNWIINQNEYVANVLKSR
jgi:hypothetical protein